MSVHYGPLLFSLPVDAKQVLVTDDGGVGKCSAEFPMSCLEPRSAWNFALPEGLRVDAITVERRVVTGDPWDVGNHPVSLKVGGARLVRNWTLDRHIRPPGIPRQLELDNRDHTLVLAPMGSTLLRTSVFAARQTTCTVDNNERGEETAMTNPINRRELLRTTAMASGAWLASGPLLHAQSKSPNEKLNIAAIGIGGRGAADVGGVAGENIVALCDVDAKRAAKTFARFPKAKQFKDFRRMFDQMHREIDAVVIGTPDHTHAPIAVMAMKLGKHCYCEKPLSHSVFEARTMANVAAEGKLVTQMGTQIHAGDNYRRVVELIKTNAIGSVREGHVWLGAKFSGPPRPTNSSQRNAPTDTPPVPKGLDWELWLGPAEVRPYHPWYAPAGWRYWWNFANGTLGDFFCHYCDLPFWALDLKHPVTVEAEGSLHAKSTSHRTIARQEYAARGELPPVTLTWYHGGGYPALMKEHSIPRWKNAVLFVGSEGMLIADYSRHQLLPEDKFAEFTRPTPFIPASIGHHREWVEACKTGGPTTCNFDYGGALTEAALLSNVALRTGKKLDWDAKTLKAVGCPEADALIRREYRNGWSL